MMDWKIQEYRQQHPKCKWCIYNKYHIPFLYSSNFQKCILKDKKTKDWKAIFCKYYTLKEE